MSFTEKSVNILFCMREIPNLFGQCGVFIFLQFGFKHALQHLGEGRGF